MGIHFAKTILNDTLRYGRRGEQSYGAGEDLSAEALAGFQSLDNSYSDRLRSGKVLDPSVVKAYSLLRGGVRDQGAGQRTIARSSVAQQAAASGGRLSPEQQASLLALGDENVGQQEFQSLNDIGVQESRDTMTAVTDLNDRIERARGVRLQAGQFKQQLGQSAQEAAINARLDRFKTATNFLKFW